jgi:hypothetical protein
MGDPRPAGAHSAGYQEEQGYPSETVDYGSGVPGQGYPSETAQRDRGATGQGSAPESAQYGRAEGRRGARAYPEDQGYGRGAGVGQGEHVGGAALTILTGLLTAFVGITGIIKAVFFSRVANYPFYYSVRSRGITEIIIGAVLVGLGVCMVLGMRWARHLALAALVIAAITAFLFIPFYPFWGILLLALSVFAAWEVARTRHAGRQMALRPLCCRDECGLSAHRSARGPHSSITPTG